MITVFEDMQYVAFILVARKRNKKKTKIKKNGQKIIKIKMVNGKKNLWNIKHEARKKEKEKIKIKIKRI